VFGTRPRQIERLAFENAVHAHRREGRRPPASHLPRPGLINARGGFNCQGIMRRAHALARRYQVSDPGRLWKALMAQALSLAWFEARTAKNARAARRAA
jgi:hypothetical protein